MGYPHASGTWLSPPLVGDNRQTTAIGGRQLPPMEVVCLVVFPLLSDGCLRQSAQPNDKDKKCYLAVSLLSL